MNVHVAQTLMKQFLLILVIHLVQPEYGIGSYYFWNQPCASKVLCTLGLRVRSDYKVDWERDEMNTCLGMRSDAHCFGDTS